MFWKVMGIVWTVLLVLAVGLLWHLAVRSPGEMAGDTPRPPRGTQATAMIGDVPDAYLPFAESLVHSHSVISLVVKDPRVMTGGEKLRLSIFNNSRKYFSTRVPGPEGVETVLIDVRNCPSAVDAPDLAGAVADSFIEYIRRFKLRRIGDEIVFARERRTDLLRQIKTGREDVTRTRFGMGWVVGSDNEAAYRMRLLTEYIMAAQSRVLLAQGRWDAYQQRAAAAPATQPAKEGRPADPKRPAPETSIPDKEVAGSKEAPTAPGVALKEALEEAVAELTYLQEERQEAKAEYSDMMEMIASVKHRESQVDRAEEELRTVSESLGKLEWEKMAAESRPSLIGVFPVK